VRKRFRPGLTLLIGVLAVAVWSGTATAGDKPPGGGTSAAVAQYVEQIPTSTGSKATGFGHTKVKPLAPAVKRKVTKQAGKDAPLLEQVATSSDYGAPQDVAPAQTVTTVKTVKKGRKAKSSNRGTKPGIPSVRNRSDHGATVVADPKATPTKALSAAANVVTDGSDGRLIGLAIFLAATTIAAFVSAAYRQRAQRQTPGR
jgi:hypothetical protein